jgi:hypothetical protein
VATNKCEVLRMVALKIIVFWEMMPYSLVDEHTVSVVRVEGKE